MLKYYELETGLSFLGEAIEAKTGEPAPSDNVGTRFENDVFLMRSYCWGCDTCDNRDWDDDTPYERCEPNFLYKPTGLSIEWYKHAGRGVEIVSGDSTPAQWAYIVVACAVSLNLEESHEL